jgi:general secretion pathway protein L
MSAPGLKSRLFELRARLHAGWRWWRDEMLALLPAGLRDALAPNDPVIAIDLQTDIVIIRRFADGGEREIARLPRASFDAASLRAVLAPALAKPWFLRDAFALRLADTMGLWRNLALPLAARRNVANVLELELERQSPLDRDEVYHDYKILTVDRQAGRIALVWRIARRKPVDAVLEICRQAGIELAVIAFVGDDRPPDGGNFPVAARASALMRLRRWLIPALAMLVLALSVAVLAGAYSRNQQAADALAARVDQARGAARVSLHLQHDIVAARQHAVFLLRQKQSLTVATLLADTTAILPDGSWLTELEYRDGEVRIAGLSNSAAALIALFDASPLFTDAQFRAPLVQAPGAGLERFDMSFKIRKGAR